MLQGIGKTKPIMITSLMKVFLNVVISYILIFGKLGFEPMNIEGAAVYTLTFGIEVVIYAIFNGTGKASMTLIGQDIGAADYESAHDYVKICIVANSLLITLCVLLFVLFSKPLLGIFTTSTKLINLASPYLIFTGIILFPKSINVIIGNAIRSHGNTKWMLYSQIIGSSFISTV